MDVIRSEFVYQPHEDKVYHKTTQPTEDLIYEQNAIIRREQPLGDLSFGRQIASIPFIAWEKAIRDGFALDSKDAAIAEKELFRFLSTPAGKKCMLRDHI